LIHEIYVGNLPLGVQAEALRQLFAEHGEVLSVTIPTYSVTRQPRSFGFVEMSETDAAKAIAALNGADFGGQTLRVRSATQVDEGAPSNGGHEHQPPTSSALSAD
jgi:RNA recognition motif-containing protein